VIRRYEKRKPLEAKYIFEDEAFRGDLVSLPDTQVESDPAKQLTEL